MSATEDVLGMEQEGRSNVPAEGPQKNRRWIKVVVAVLWMLVLGVVGLLGTSFFVLILTNSSIHRFTPKIQNCMRHVQVAVGHYRAEYNLFPVDRTDSRNDLVIRSEGPVLAALIGDDSELNVRNIQFLEPWPAREGRFGFIEEDGKWRLVDVWGEMFYMVMDLNLDNHIANPEHRSGKPKTTIPEKLPNSFIMYSSGPDRDPKTWEDNVRSWQ